MKKLLIIVLLMACAFDVQAQEAVQQEDPKVTEMRQQIGIDCTGGHIVMQFDTASQSKLRKPKFPS